MKKYLLYIFIIPILAFTFTGGPPSGWYQQFLPDVSGMPISDMEFLDSLTGFIVTGDGTPNDTNYILKTTNGGDNWNIIFQDYRNFFKIKFISDSIGYVCGGFNDVMGALYKTTNRGNNWVRENTPIGNHFNDMAVLNEDTIWVVDDGSLNGGVYRTTNGGVNWTNQYFNSGGNPDHIYMINGRVGFMGAMFKTTNSGLNWFQVDVQSMGNMYFKDTLTGWRANGSMKKTTNGGINWVNQTLPSGGIILTSSMRDIAVIDEDTIIGVGGEAFLGPGQFRGLIWKTTNGGQNWDYQLPDTSIHSPQMRYIEFVNCNIGWAYWPGGGIHTTKGVMTNINQQTNTVPESFRLFQNYPNPFNPTTTISYKISSKGEVKLSVYDISGKEIQQLVNNFQQPGTYQYTFDGSGLSSGVYFYKLETEKISDVKKMILVK